MVKQVGIAAEDGGLTEQLLLVVEVEVLLAAELQDLAVGVGVFGGDECGASCRSVFGHETPRFVSDSTRVTKRFRPHWPGPPLGRLFRCTVQALPPLSVGAFSSLRRRRLGRFRSRCVVVVVALGL